LPVRMLRNEEVSVSRLELGAPFGAFAPNVIQRGLIALGQNTFLKRGFFRGFVANLIFRLGRGRLDIRFRDCAFRLNNNRNLIEYGLMLAPEYNQADIRFLLHGAKPDANFVDVGSNVGLYALPAARTSPSGTVLAIDANAQMAQALMFNVEASGLRNVRMVACAVSDKDGRGDLAIRKEDLAIVSLVEAAEGSVQVRTLASVIAEADITSIHGLKIDIEGHEDKALAPFLEAAPQSLLPLRIVIEHPWPDDDYPACKAAFAKRGYTLKGRSRNNSFYLLGA
jgi:FkbM family methyltransferase